MDAEKLKALQKKHGKDLIYKYGSGPSMSVEAVSSGSLGLDIALGVGGYPRGRIIECWGHESAGKTTLALHAIAEVQKRGGQAAFIDAEHALDPKYAEDIGVDMTELFMSQPDNGEQALDIAESLVDTGELDIIVIDSVAALVPQAEIAAEMEKASVGLQARMLSKGLRKLAAKLNKTKTILFFINQTRMKIGVMYGSPTTTAGGESLKFYASVRMEIARKAVLKEGEVAVGNKVRVKIAKNKVAPPLKEAFFDIRFGHGIDRFGEILDLACLLNIVEKSGASFKMGDEKVGYGRDNTVADMKVNPALTEKLENAIQQHYKR